MYRTTPVSIPSASASTTNSNRLGTHPPTTTTATVSSSPPPFWFGGAASCIATFVSHPFDLTKVRIQTEVKRQQQLQPRGSVTWDWRLLRPSNMIRTMRSIVHTEGVKALYCGLDASLLRQGTYSTIRFGLYDHFKWLMAGDQKPTFQQLLICSTAAGILGGAFGNPSDVVNVRMQGDGQLPLDKQRHYKNALDGMYRICREEGPRVLLRGLGTSTQRAVLITVSQMTSYDVFKMALVQRLGWYEDGMITHFSASLLAGLVATTVCSPLDVVKTRIMSAHVHDSNIPIRQIMLQMIKKEGFGSLFRGWMPAYIRLGPHTIVTFLVLEKLKEHYAGVANNHTLNQE